MEFVTMPNSNRVEGFCLIKTVEKKLTQKGLPYLDLLLTDRSGEIVAKFWDYKDGHYEPNMLIKIRGEMLEYKGEPQLRIERMRPAADSDNIRIEDFVPSSEYSGRNMIDRIYGIIECFEDSELKLLTQTMIHENEEKLLYWPAAFKLHHAIRSGLLYHTLSVVQMAEKVCDIYPSIDRDLLLTGAILHDIAKLEEFEVSDTGIASSYTTDGELVGHLVRGAMMVEKTAEKLNISEETKRLVEHMLISHHGVPEYGAAVRPLFIEAEVLSALDSLDAKIYEFADTLSGVEKNGFSARHWALDNRKLYNHGRKEMKAKANLE